MQPRYVGDVADDTALQNDAVLETLRGEVGKVQRGVYANGGVGLPAVDACGEGRGGNVSGGGERGHVPGLGLAAGGLPFCDWCGGVD